MSNFLLFSSFLLPSAPGLVGNLSVIFSVGFGGNGEASDETSADGGADSGLNPGGRNEETSSTSTEPKRLARSNLNSVDFAVVAAAAAAGLAVDDSGVDGSASAAAAPSSSSSSAGGSLKPGGRKAETSSNFNLAPRP